MSFQEYSRREFLSFFPKAGLLLRFPPSSNILNGSRRQSFHGLPQDILSEEELSKLRVRICSTFNTQLYLRPSALSIPLFADSRRGTIDETVIALVDDNYLTHDSTRDLPDDVRMLWDAIMPQNMDRDQSLRGFFARGGTRSYLYSNNEELGKFLDSHPEYEKRMYIFLSVGGALTPHPEDSYPTPEVVLRGCEEQPVRTFDYYRFYPRPNNPAFVLLHELGHYHLRLSMGEWMADNYAIDMITYNSNRYQTTGDTSSFPFVFVNNEGITVT